MAKLQQSFFKNMIKVVFRANFEDENSDDDENKLIIKHNPINSNQSLNSINYLASEHTKCLQQSPYIKIEDDTDKILEQMCN